MPLDSDAQHREAAGLEGVVAAETVLSMVDGEGGELVVRGHRLGQVSGRSFEWLAGELWRDFVDRDLSERSLRRDLGAARLEAFKDIRPYLPAISGMQPVSALRLLAASVPDGCADEELRLVATVSVGLGAAVRLGAGREPVAPDREAGHAEDLLRSITGKAGTTGQVQALEAYLVTAMDHGLNASTFAARVVASTRAGVSASVTAALCALKGPLHGGAPGPVLDMLDAIGFARERRGLAGRRRRARR